jgi:nucleotide-binding universal stress UspA family protein
MTNLVCKASFDPPGSLPRTTLNRREPKPLDNPPGSNFAEPSADDARLDWRIQHILAPTDFSPSSAEAVSRAAALAREHDATLTILHVIDVNPPSAHSHCGTADDLMRNLRTTATTELCRLAQSLKQTQTKTRTRIVEGLPAEVIVENSPGFDLVVLGERSPKSPWNLFSRHTARRVIQAAECPVLVVPRNARLLQRNPEQASLAAV